MQLRVKKQAKFGNKELKETTYSPFERLVLHLLDSPFMLLLHFGDLLLVCADQGVELLLELCIFYFLSLQIVHRLMSARQDISKLSQQLRLLPRPPYQVLIRGIKTKTFKGQEPMMQEFYQSQRLHT